MSTKHAEGPLHVGGGDDATLYDKFGQRVANAFEGVMATHRSDAQCQANARRIAACWNACEGLSTESLERTDAGDTLRNRASRQRTRSAVRTSARRIPAMSGKSRKKAAIQNRSNWAVAFAVVKSLR